MSFFSTSHPIVPTDTPSFSVPNPTGSPASSPLKQVALQAFPPPSTVPTLPKPLLPFTEAAAISAQLVPLPLGIAHITSGVSLLI